MKHNERQNRKDFETREQLELLLLEGLQGEETELMREDWMGIRKEAQTQAAQDR